jgi:tetratricopeptide (TPR) repeat protein
MVNYFQLYTICFSLFFALNGFAQQNSSQNFYEILSEADNLSLKGDYDKALVLYEDAVQIIPDTISTIARVNLYNSLTKKYAFLGLFDEARKRTRELFFQNLDIANKEYLIIEGAGLMGVYEAFEGDYNSALDFSVISVALALLNQEKAVAKHGSFRINALAGKQEQSINQLQELFEQNPRPEYLIWLTYLLQEKGADKMVQQLLPKLDQLKQMSEAGKIEGYGEGAVLYGLAMGEVINGDHEKAIDYLRKSYSAGNKEYYWWKNFNPMFHELEQYSDYQDLMKRMKSDIDQMRESYLESKAS